MKFHYYVITKVPSIFDEEQGNLSHDVYYQDYDYANRSEPIFKIGDLLSGEKKVPSGEIMVPVFHVGEIVICDTAYGREVCYPGRKPSKWFIEYEIFTNLSKAVERAHKLTYN